MSRGHKWNYDDDVTHRSEYCLTVDMSSVEGGFLPAGPRIIR
jgi:hypothetical protein